MSRLRHISAWLVVSIFMVLTAYAVSAPKGTGATTRKVYAEEREEPQDDNRNRNRKRENSNNNAGDKGKFAFSSIM